MFWLQNTVQRVIFEAFIFREQPIQFLFAKSNFTNGDTEPRLLHINYLNVTIIDGYSNFGVFICFQRTNFGGFAPNSPNQYEELVTKILQRACMQMESLKMLPRKCWMVWSLIQMKKMASQPRSMYILLLLCSKGKKIIFIFIIIISVVMFY